MTFDAVTIAAFVVALVPGVILHEISHAVVANAMGDPTAKAAGRLTLNPIRHIDPFGTLILPGLLIALAAAGLGGVVFGYAKPVPIDPTKLRHRRVQMLAISVAGPLTNLLLAVLAALVLRQIAPSASVPVVEFVLVWILLNVFLAVFNLLPIPPLDGSELIAAALPEPLLRGYRAIQRYGFLILMVLLFWFPQFIDALTDPVYTGLLRWLVA